MSADARSRTISRAILLAGFACSILIYFINAPTGDAPGYVPEDSKQYLREMERIGGKANVLASEIRSWFDGLWHGRSLAFTVAVLTLLLALAYRVSTTPLPPAAGGIGGREKDGAGKSS